MATSAHSSVLLSHIEVSITCLVFGGSTDGSSWLLAAFRSISRTCSVAKLMIKDCVMLSGITVGVGNEHPDFWTASWVRRLLTQRETRLAFGAGGPAQRSSSHAGSQFGTGTIRLPVAKTARAW